MIFLAVFITIALMVAIIFASREKSSISSGDIRSTENKINPKQLLEEEKKMISGMAISIENADGKDNTPVKSLFTVLTDDKPTIITKAEQAPDKIDTQETVSEMQSEIKSQIKTVSDLNSQTITEISKQLQTSDSNPITGIETKKQEEDRVSEASMRAIDNMEMKLTGKVNWNTEASYVVPPGDKQIEKIEESIQHEPKEEKIIPENNNPKIIASKQLANNLVNKLLQGLKAKTSVTQDKSDPITNAYEKQTTTTGQQSGSNTGIIQDDSVIDVSGNDIKIDYNTTGISDTTSTQQLLTSVNSYDDYATDSYSLGKRFKDKLELSGEEVVWCDSVGYYENVFTAIKGCCQETVRVYASVVGKLKKKLAVAGISFETEQYFFTTKILDELKGQMGYYFYNDNNYLERVAKGEFFCTIFKRVENKIREAFGHKRKVNDDFPRHSLMPEFENRIGKYVNEILNNNIIAIKEPTAATETVLNEINTTRWKKDFDQLKEKLTVPALPKFLKSISKLEKLNEKNPSIENIFFEASKVVAKLDKVESLKLYIKYIHYDLISLEINNKQHNKTIQKSLFKTKEQLNDFTAIITVFTKTKDIEKAMRAAEQLYIPKRKKIRLDQNIISEVRIHDSETVELLNEYLEDEDGNVSANTEIKLEIPEAPQTNPLAQVADNLSLDSNQLEAITLFRTNNYNLIKPSLEQFCKGKGLMPSAFIESINQCCYDSLDDLLIEDDGEQYSINQTYYSKIITG